MNTDRPPNPPPNPSTAPPPPNSNIANTLNNPTRQKDTRIIEPEKVVLYKLFARIIFQPDVEVMRALVNAKQKSQVKAIINRETGQSSTRFSIIHIQIIDYIAALHEQKPPVGELKTADNTRVTVSEQQLKARLPFSAAEQGALQQLIKGLLIIPQENKTYRLNPGFLEAVEPILGELEERCKQQKEAQQKQLVQFGEEGTGSFTLCAKCNTKIDKSLVGVISHIRCSKCSSSELVTFSFNRKAIEAEIRRINSMLAHIEFWRERKTAIEGALIQKRSRELQQFQEKKNQETSNYKFQMLLESIKLPPDGKKATTEDELKTVVPAHDTLTFLIKKEGSWMKRLDELRHKRATDK